MSTLRPWWASFSIPSETERLKCSSCSPTVPRVPSLVNLAIDHAVELQLPHAYTSAELDVRRLVAGQVTDPVSILEGVVGEDRVDPRVDIRQQAPHPSHEVPNGALAAPVACGSAKGYIGTRSDSRA